MKTFSGLDDATVKQNRAKYGENILTKQKRQSFGEKYLEKFNDPIIIILLVALGINVVFTFFGKVDWFECLGIFISVMIATLVGAISEYKNEESFQKIQDEASKNRCKVYRDGLLKELLWQEVVKDDMVLLEAGDLIPADGFLCDGEIYVDQSTLNGESKEVLKTIGNQNNEADFWDKSSLFRGTVVCQGRGVLRVTSVGDATQYGRLNKESQIDRRQSPLQVKLGVLAKKISFFGYIGAVIVFLLCILERMGAKLGGDFTQIAVYFQDMPTVVSDMVSSLIVAITVVVVAVPEGLPLMIAIVCSLNMKKMMKNNVLVRKLIGIETAGSINILFSDKTGTITKGKLAVTEFVDGSLKEYKNLAYMDEKTAKMLYISIAGNTSARFSGTALVGGNSTEKALMEFVRSYRDKGTVIRKEKEQLFSSERKYSSALVTGDFCGVLVKGAPEIILPRCRDVWSADGVKGFFNATATAKKADAMAEKGIRVIALAIGSSFDDGLPRELTFVGLVGLRDEIRKDVPGAVESLSRAGIQTVMITGDKKETALAIAKEAGIVNSPDDIVITSGELAVMCDREIANKLKNIKVVARALPTDKSRLVKIAQECHLVAGMTGDGVNDLPALKAADVGFAMGSGTDIARESGDIVILDDNFSSIKKAVLYGRTIYKSIKKFITCQLTINIAAVSVSVLGPIIGIDKPLGITQMLWINLCMDTLAAIAFGGEGALARYMLEKPRPREENIIDKKMWSSIAVGGLFISALSLFMFISQDMYCAFRGSENDAVFYTGYFGFFVFACIFNAFNTRAEGVDLLENLALNKSFLAIIFLICAVQVAMTHFGGRFLGTADLNIREWMQVLVMAVLIIPVDIIRKLIVK